MLTYIYALMHLAVDGNWSSSSSLFVVVIIAVLAVVGRQFLFASALDALWVSKHDHGLVVYLFQNGVTAILACFRPVFRIEKHQAQF
jgi:hypothetical protein